MWKSTSELGYRRRKHGDEVASMAWDVRRVDGVGRPKFDFHTGWKEGGVYRKSIEDGPMRAALERLWASQRDQANKGFEALVAADIAADGDGKWWLRHEKRHGPSRFFGVDLHVGRWQVRVEVDGKQMYIGRCDEEEDAARLVDFLLVVVRREAPRNLTESFVEWLETGCDCDVPTELVVAALQRVGHVRVSGAELDGAAEAWAALAAAEKEIEKARDHRLAWKELSDSEVPKRHPKSRSIEPTLGATATQVEVMEEAKDGPEDLYDLALIDVDIKQLALAMTKGTCSSYTSARRTLWRWKREAADLLGVKLAWDPPPMNGTGTCAKLERTPAQQDALDVASRWAAARAGTVDADLATKYAEALAAIARDCVAKQQKKKKRRR